MVTARFQGVVRRLRQTALCENSLSDGELLERYLAQHSVDGSWWGDDGDSAEGLNDDFGSRAVSLRRGLLLDFLQRFRRLAPGRLGRLTSPHFLHARFIGGAHRFLVPCERLVAVETDPRGS
jgi:hypothetical protein